MVWNVQGKIGVITGASCPLGREIIKRLSATHKMKLACVSRNPSALPPLAPDCTAFKADIQSSSDCDALLKSVHSSMGPVSLLINCAGVTLSKVHMRCSDEDYDAIMNTNLRGALQLTRATLRHGGMLKLRDASVLHIGSVAGVIGNEGQVLYAASKAALTGATKSWALEYGARNVRFNVVAPGLMDGEGMMQTLSPAQVEKWKGACPLKRIATVGEVADVVVSVALSTFLNGQTIAVDGGIS